MRIEITSVTARDGGAHVCVTAKITQGENSETRDLILTCSQFAEIGIEKGVIDCDKFDEILDAAHVCLALKLSFKILGYGTCSERELFLKLTHKGIEPQYALGALRIIMEKEYINEKEDAERIAQTEVRRFHGKKRIIYALRRRGYRDDAVRYALDSISDTDYRELCVEYIKSKYDEIPSNTYQRNKLYACLIRMGHTSSDIMDAFSRIGPNSDYADY